LGALALQIAELTHGVWQWGAKQFSGHQKGVAGIGASQFIAAFLQIHVRVSNDVPFSSSSDRVTETWLDASVTFGGG
jgi:hypothetical protein